MPNFALNNAGPANVVIAPAIVGQRYRVRSFSLTFQDGNRCFFRSGLTGNPISPDYQAGAGASLSPQNTGGYIGFTTGPGEPLVLTIAGSGTITGEALYDLLAPG